MILFIYFIHLF